MLRLIFITIGTLAIFGACSIIGTELQDCPFKDLPYSKKTYTEQNLQASFAKELDVNLSIIRKSIDVGIKPAVAVELNNTIRKYEEEVLCPDSAFVGYFNAHARVICYYFAMYISENKSKTSAENLDGALKDLQDFVNMYCATNMKKDYRIAYELQELNMSIRNEVVAMQRTTNDPVIRINLDAFAEKLSYLQSKIQGMALENINPNTIGQAKALYVNLMQIQDEFNRFKMQI